MFYDASLTCMKLLIRLRLLDNESIESYLLRLALANGFAKYSEFSSSIKIKLKEQVDSSRLEGAFPSSLVKLNLYKAGRTSAFRVRAIKLTEEIAGLQQATLLTTAILRTNLKFGTHQALSTKNILFPRMFLREVESGIPVCPICLKDNPCIRQNWHFKPYISCHIHNVKLLTHCPECKDKINYLHTELIAKCSCGYRLDSYVGVGKPEQTSVPKLAKMLLDKADPKLTNFIGKLFWFSQYKGVELDCESLLSAYNDYFSDWPNKYLSELRTLEESAIEKQVTLFNKISVNDVWPKHISLSKLASPFRHENPILDVITDYFIDLVDRNPRSKCSNIADTLINSLDAATLLRTSSEQVFLLAENGYLDIVPRMTEEQYLQPHIPKFYLRQVVELMEAQGASKSDFNHYTSAW